MARGDILSAMLRPRPAPAEPIGLPRMCPTFTYIKSRVGAATKPDAVEVVEPVEDDVVVAAAVKHVGNVVETAPARMTPVQVFIA